MLSILLKDFLIVSCLTLLCTAQENCEETSVEEKQILRGIRGGVSTDDVFTTPPYHVSLIHLDTDTFQLYFLCSGALISTKHVLTSAKCMEKATSEDMDMVAVVGKTTFDPNNRETFYSTGSYIQYDTRSANDIAILPLQSAVNVVKGQIETVQIPASQSKMGICSRKLKNLQLSGGRIDFGTIITSENTSFQNNVKVTRHDVLGRIKCNRWIRRRFGNNQGSLMCTKPMNYQSCIGDLGSPLVKPLSNGYRNELLGLAAYDMKACRTIPIIYTYVPTYVSWINWIIYTGIGY